MRACRLSRLILLLLISFPLLAHERIVTLSPAIAEMVAGLGETDHIVAVSDYTLHPEVLKKRPKVGGYTTLSVERVLAQKPTLVIGLEHQRAFMEQVEAFGIRTVAVRPESIADIRQSITVLSDLLDRKEEGKRLVEAIDESLENAPKLSGPASVLIVFANASSLSRGVYVAGHDLFFEEILHACGATNAYTAEYSLQPVLNAEGVIATNPDHVLLLSGLLDKVDVDALKKRWEALPIKAARNGNIRVLRNDYILIPSHRIPESIQTICGAIR